jgi:glycolate oxidase FAD binding subunit
MIATEDLIAAARHQVEPATPDEMAAALKRASESRLQTVIRGGGTKIDWGRTPAAVDVVIGTSRLNQVVAHRHGDLTGTFQAGAKLRDVNAVLGAHRQWLPIESAFEEATIGGIVATNDAGPIRHRYGTSRDLLIGMTLALTDGRIVKAGGHVVKNVAGYDLARLMSGSFGTLAGIVDATFKLSPVWPVSQTLVADFDGAAPLNVAVQALRESQLEPVACDLHASIARGSTRCRLFVRCATSPAATAAQVERARALVQAPSTTLSGADEAALWHTHTRAPWQGDGAIVRMSWLPAGLADAMTLLMQAASTSATTMELAARAGVGAGVLRIEGDQAAQARAIAELRATAPAIGNVAVLRASATVRQQLDVWPDTGQSQTVYRALRRSLDPAGILNAGRGPV